MKRTLALLLSILFCTVLGSAAGTAAGRWLAPGPPVAPPPAGGLVASPLVAIGDGFTYQGRLLLNGAVATGAYDLTFTLFDAASGGTQIGSPITVLSQTLSVGTFTAALDFGGGAFQGTARWLQIAVRAAGSGAYTTLAPRQALTPAPYALWAQAAPWAGIAGKPAPYSPNRLANLQTVLDNTTNSVGLYTAATVGADGLPLISYYESFFGDLRVAHCNDGSCTTATVTTLDSTGGVGSDTAITIGTDGLGLISYYDSTNNDLKLAHCNNVTCSAATLTTVDSAGSVGQHTAITVDQNGYALISYFDATNQNLKMVVCHNVTCSTTTLRTLDGATASVGRYTSITIGTDGLPLISYYDETNGALKVAHCNIYHCSSLTLATLDADAAGAATSITIGADGLGLITYSGTGAGALKVAHCNDVACSAATLATLAGTTGAGHDSSITIGTDGLGLISYYDYTSTDLKFAHCRNVTCSVATLRTLVSSAGAVGQYTAITIGADGLPLISYYDGANGDLKVLHCGSPFCVSYYHRR